MAGQHFNLERRIRLWWVWFALALYLLITIDMITTMGSIAKYGIAVEGNPLMQRLFQQGLLAVVVVNLAVTAFAGGCFQAVVSLVRRMAPARARYFAYCVEAWLGILVLGGMLLALNNLGALLFGYSLL